MEQPRQRININDLTRGLLSDVLCKLPIESIIICKSVCKSWNRLIKDRKFAVQHLHRNAGPNQPLVQPYWLDQDQPEDGGLVDNHLCLLDVEARLSWRLPAEEFYVSQLRVMGTCHGLVVAASRVNLEPIYVCNPVTRVTVRLPLLREKTMQRSHCVGIGFDSSIHKYKVLRTYVDEGIRSFKSIVVGNGSWKKTNVPDENLTKCGVSSPVFWKGAIHWKVTPQEGSDVGLSILAFDVTTEKFQMIPMPYDSNLELDLVVLGESLTVIEHVKEKMRVYEMKGGRVGQFELFFLEERDTHVLWNKYHYYNVIDRSDEEESYLFQITASYGNRCNIREHFTQFFPKLAIYSYREVFGLPQNFKTICNFKPSLISPIM